jgi:hypothetical protein
VAPIAFSWALSNSVCFSVLAFFASLLYMSVPESRSRFLLVPLLLPDMQQQQRRRRRRRGSVSGLVFSRMRERALSLVRLLLLLLLGGGDG